MVEVVLYTLLYQILGPRATQTRVMLWGRKERKDLNMIIRISRIDDG